MKDWFKQLLIKNFTEILPWIFTLLIIVSFGYFLDSFMSRQNQAMHDLQLKIVKSDNHKEILIDKEGTIKSYIAEVSSNQSDKNQTNDNRDGLT